MEIKIDKTASDQRFDRFLRKWFKKYPQVRLADIYSVIRRGLVKVNNKKVKEQYRLKVGDSVQIHETVKLGAEDLSAITSQKDRKLEKVDIKKVKQQVLYEDGHRIVFDKLPGIPMHPGNKHRNDLCMNDYLDKYAEEYKTSTFKPSFGYRLDRDTSGVLIAAKSYEALQYINSIIRERDIDKYYLALVVGKFQKHLIIKKPLTKTYNKESDRSQVRVDYDEGLEATTECWLERFIQHPLLGPISLLKVKIHTGRMHQIRVHVSSEGFPVLGDVVYGNPGANRILYKSLGINRQLLHCRKYSFLDPFQNDQVTFEAPVPADFKKVLSGKAETTLLTNGDKKIKKVASRK
ncbi:MAG: RluA family pseudouridine synthase [candidate division SR1 bacterium]|nr:RluA family pseudouridine synthase [candidate division SR1 bacterium]